MFQAATGSSVLTRDAMNIASANRLCASPSAKSGNILLAQAKPGHAIMFQLISNCVILSLAGL